MSMASGLGIPCWETRRRTAERAGAGREGRRGCGAARGLVTWPNACRPNRAPANQARLERPARSAPPAALVVAGSWPHLVAHTGPCQALPPRPAPTLWWNTMGVGHCPEGAARGTGPGTGQASSRVRRTRPPPLAPVTGGARQPQLTSAASAQGDASPANVKGHRRAVVQPGVPGGRMRRPRPRCRRRLRPQHQPVRDQVCPRLEHRLAVRPGVPAGVPAACRRVQKACVNLSCWVWLPPAASATNAPFACPAPPALGYLLPHLGRAGAWWQ